MKRRTTLVRTVDGRHGRRVALVMAAALLVSSTGVRADKSVYDWAFIRLDYARKEKAQQLRTFCDRIHALARQARQDEFVVALFDIIRRHSDPEIQGLIPEDVAAKVAKLQADFNRYYFEKYLVFYDVLFVDMQGKIFYSIRKESDLGHGLFEDNTRQDSLSLCLRQKPTTEVFVDFHYYEPSSEAAAFIVEPMSKDGVQIGWVVLQCAINKANTLLAWTEDLGQTGETFLVNQEGFMLTESNFEGASTILRKRLDDRNIHAKFAEKKGHRIVTDYRGCVALSSFEVVEFLGTRWLIVAKIDRDEVVTQHYAQHRRYYADKLLVYLKESPPVPLREGPPVAAQAVIRVDMDEFLRAGQKQCLHTFGVSTCTALLVAYPGRFAYLAHISPRDKVYGQADTNLLGQMLKRVETFDIYHVERHRLVFVVVAPNLNGLLGIVDKLIEEGFLLSQIRMFYNPQAKSAEVCYDYAKDDLSVGWQLQDPSVEARFQLMEDARNVGTIIHHVIQADERAPATKPE